MPRVKRGNKRRLKRKKILRRAKGYYLAKSKLYRIAREQVQRSLNFAYRDRRARKREFRRLWIVRINAAARQHELSYSGLMHGLKRAGVTLDRRMLAELAARDPAAFGKLVEAARQVTAAA
jgi:large subunit ribosomal protein L20